MKLFETYDEFFDGLQELLDELEKGGEFVDELPPEVMENLAKLDSLLKKFEEAGEELVTSQTEVLMMRKAGDLPSTESVQRSLERCKERTEKIQTAVAKIRKKYRLDQFDEESDS